MRAKIFRSMGDAEGLEHRVRGFVRTRPEKSLQDWYTGVSGVAHELGHGLGCVRYAIGFAPFY